MSLIFIDTETTGLNPDLHDLWEVAAIEEDGTEHHWFLDAPADKADPIALGIGGFHARHPKGWEVVTRGAPDFVTTNDLQFCLDFGHLTNGAHLVGAVPHFDAEFLRRRFLKRGFQPAWHYHLIDVEAMAVGYLHGYEGTRQPVAVESQLAIGLPWKSDDLSRSCGVAPPGEDDRHTALGDARWVQRWYEAITGGAA